MIPGNQKNRPPLDEPSFKLAVAKLIERLVRLETDVRTYEGVLANAREVGEGAKETARRFHSLFSGVEEIYPPPPKVSLWRKLLAFFLFWQRKRILGTREDFWVLMPDQTEYRDLWIGRHDQIQREEIPVIREYTEDNKARYDEFMSREDLENYLRDCRTLPNGLDLRQSLEQPVVPVEDVKKLVTEKTGQIDRDLDRMLEALKNIRKRLTEKYGPDVAIPEDGGQE